MNVKCQSKSYSFVCEKRLVWPVGSSIAEILDAKFSVKCAAAKDLCSVRKEVK